MNKTSTSQSSSDENGHPRSSRRKGAGRASRLKERQNKSPAKSVWPGVSGGQFKPLSDVDMSKIHQGALNVLANVGIADHTEELRQLVLPKGCTLNKYGRLCFPESLMEDLIAGARKDYMVYARGERAGKDDIHCDGTKVHFSTTGSAVTTFEAATKTYRPSTIQDVYDFTRLTDTLEHVHMCGDTVIATELTDDFEHDMNIVYSLTAGTEKPLCLSFRSRDFINPAIKLFDYALGGEGRFMKKPFCIFGGCPIVSPLRFGRENLEVLIEASRLGLTSDIAVAPQSGATAPAPLAGILTQVIAETLACLAVVNLINPGCAMTFAAWPFITDLRTGSFSGGSGEQALLAAAAVQMGNFYNLPNSVGAAMTDSKIPDAQAGLEKGISLTLAALAGCNRVCEAAGMMGSLMGCSFESLYMDNEMLGMILRAVRGIEVNDETLSLDVIKSAAIDPGHFLGNPQTLQFMESEYLYPTLMDRAPTDAWEKDGSRDTLERSRHAVGDIMRSHFPNYLGSRVDQIVRSQFPIKISRDDMSSNQKRWN
ncbi:MAG: trimethylamine methyltransferase [Hyphomicrobiales bacterium]|nr:trimethylamine methyltransferase [Hyphomicrobiales bacterium]